MTAVPPLRVLHVCAPARAGGLESVVHQLTAGLHGRGHDVRVAAVLSPGDHRGHPLVVGLEQVGVPVHVVVAGARDYQAERAAVRALAVEHRVQVVHTHGYRADVIDGRVAQSVGSAHVTTLHGFTARSWRGHLYEWLQVRSARRAQAAIAVSKPIFARLRSATCKADVHLVPNAVARESASYSREESRRRLNLPQDAFVVGWVGRLSSEKGPDLFVDALGLLNSAPRETVPLQAAIIGDGPESSSLMQRAESHGLTETLHFAGFVSGASKYLSAFDALALTSRTEGTPMVVLEAMLAGIPVLATAVGGIPDLLSNDCAYLCEPLPQSIASQLSLMASDENGRRDRARAASLRAESSYSYDAWIDSHERIYRQAIAAVHGRRGDTPLGGVR